MKDEARLLKRVVELLVEKLDARAVILFGSRTRRDWKPWSDYDLLVVADYKEKYLDRIGKILEILKDIPLPIEPHPYTPNEALSMLRRGNPAIVDALEEGRVLYATEWLEKLVREYQELKKKGLKKTYTTVVLPEYN